MLKFVVTIFVLSMNLCLGHVNNYWDLNDVTYVFPLPSLNSYSQYLHFEGLFPKKWFTHDLATDGLNFTVVPNNFKFVNIGSAKEVALRNAELAVGDAKDRGNKALFARRYQQRQQHNQFLIQPKWITKDEYNFQSMELLERLTLLAFRIDPCFKDEFSDQCKKQIRVVWQPIDLPVKNRELSTYLNQNSNLSLENRIRPLNSVDATIHTFYDLNDSEFFDLVSNLKTIKNKFKLRTKSLPLGVHPGFKIPSFQKELQDILKKYIKPENISRVAFMQLNDESLRWSFFSFDVINDKLIPILPKWSKKFTQVISFSSPNSGRLLDERENLFTFDSGEQLLGPTPYNFSSSEIYKRVKAINNPRKHLPGTIDCLSCHSAPSAYQLAFKSAQQNANQIGPSVEVANELQRFNFSNFSNYEVGNFRMLGYFEENLVISDRVIVESAEVANILNNNPQANQ